MGTSELKADLHRMIDGVKSKKTLSALHSFLSENFAEGDWAADLSEEAQKSILTGIQQEKEGKVISHQQILTRHREQFPHLNLK